MKTRQRWKGKEDRRYLQAAMRVHPFLLIKKRKKTSQQQGKQRGEHSRGAEADRKIQKEARKVEMKEGPTGEKGEEDVSKGRRKTEKKKKTGLEVLYFQRLRLDTLPLLMIILPFLLLTLPLLLCILPYDLDLFITY